MYFSSVRHRDFFIVQDYVFWEDDDTLVTYNESIDHVPYYAPREGFVRMTIRNQGLVAVRVQEKDASSSYTATSQTLRGRTRLTWLVNCDLGGNVPKVILAFLPFILLPFSSSRSHSPAISPTADVESNIVIHDVISCNSCEQYQSKQDRVRPGEGGGGGNTRLAW